MTKGGGWITGFGGGPAGSGGGGFAGVALVAAFAVVRDGETCVVRRGRAFGLDSAGGSVGAGAAGVDFS